MTDQRQQEIDQNLEFFLRELPTIPAENQGKFALIRQQQIVAFYDTAADAVRAGNTQFPDKLFSIQQVTTVSTNLGFYSYARDVGATQ